MPGSPHVTVIEEGGGGRRPESARHALASASITLTLAILGSSVLPIPYAFSRLGVLPGLAIMLVVAASNSLSGTLLLRCASSLDKGTFESLAETVGGPTWKLVTEVCLVLLLWGNLTGDFCLLADMGTIATQELFPGGPPAWLVAGNGRLLMAALALLVVFPLSCLRHLRQLDKAGLAGVGFVAVVAAIFVRCAVGDGLPAVASGELPLWRPAVTANLPEAVGVLSFAFYLTPMLLPLLREMPAGKLGVDLTCRAVQIVTVGVAYLTYAVIGFFAAARYGLRTEGDVLVNQWLPGRWDGVLGAFMTVYLSVCMAPMAITLRCQLENLLLEEDAAMPRGRQVALTGACLLSSLLLALAFPTSAEKMFAVTGATAVCAVCYVLPVAIHLKLYLRGSGWWRGAGAGVAGKGRGAPWLARRRSFSFDHRAPPGGPLAGGGPGGGSNDRLDPRWLLAADYQAGSAALPRMQATSSSRVAAAFAAHLGDAAAAGQVPPLGLGRQGGAAEGPQQQQQQGAEWGEEEEEGEGQERRSRADLLSGHKWTDLSLNRWLRGQSYDSVGGMSGYPDSLPATPLSPGASSSRACGRGGGRDSMDSLNGGGDQLDGWDPLGSDEEQQQQQQQQTPPWSPEAAPLLPSPGVARDAMPLLPAVPEAASLAGADFGRPGGGGGGGGYPCLADAGSGRDAVLPLLWHVVLPLGVLLLGVASSISALCLAVAALV